jgi:tetratricopeptide (TPR) repeat protein
MLLRQVLEEEPQPPRRLNDAVPRDLETICLHCLNKEPRRRYPTAQALADDLRRFLAGEPIRARPSGILERGVKWARRRRAVAALLGVSLFAGLALLGGGVWFTARLRRERDHAREGWQRAETNFALAREAVDHYCTRVSEELLLNQPGLQELRKDLLQEALRYYQRFVRQQGDDRALEAELGLAYGRLAIVTGEIESQSQAVEYCQQAVAIFERLAAEHPEVAPYRESLGTAHVTRGHQLYAMGRLAEAEAALHQGRAVREELARQEAQSEKYRHHLAEAQSGLALTHHAQGRHAAAEADCRAALAIWKQLRQEYPKNPRYGNRVVTTCDELGLICQRTGKPDQVDAAFREGLAIGEELLLTHPRNPEQRSALAMIYSHMGSFYRGNRRTGQAEKALRRSVALQEPLVEEHPRVLRFVTYLGGTYCNLGNLQFATARPDGALDSYVRAIRTLEAVLRQDARHALSQEFLSKSLGGRAQVMDQQQRHAEALPDWDRAMQLPGEEPWRDFVRFRRALALAQTGDHARAAAEAEALAGRKTATAEDLYNLACVCALSATAAARDDRLGVPEAAGLPRQYADQAMTLLRQAVQKGYKDVPHMKKDTDLDPLRSREDFQAILRELEAAAQPKQRADE